MILYCNKAILLMSLSAASLVTFGCSTPSASAVSVTATAAAGSTADGSAAVDTHILIQPLIRINENKSQSNNYSNGNDNHNTTNCHHHIKTKVFSSRKPLLSLPPPMNTLFHRVSSKGNQLFTSCIKNMNNINSHTQTYYTFGKMNENEYCRQQYDDDDYQHHANRSYNNLDIHTSRLYQGHVIPISLQSLAGSLRRNVLEQNKRFIELPFATPSLSSSSSTKRTRSRKSIRKITPIGKSNTNKNNDHNTFVSSVLQKKRKSNDYDDHDEKQHEQHEKDETKKQRRRNNTGFYYGIQDDVFFKDSKTGTTGTTDTTDTTDTTAYDHKKNNKNYKNSKSHNEGDNLSSSSQSSPLSSLERKATSNGISTYSSELSDIMGETLLELREMREDIMALREEMHYIKEEMKRNNRMQSSSSSSDTSDYEQQLNDNEYEEEDLNYNDIDDPIKSITMKIRRRQAFEMISKDVEKWAHKLLFEEDDEEYGWKEVICNKMVRNKFNRDGSTKCYIKWMKDTRNLDPLSSQINNDNRMENMEYPCIKCYATLDAPIDQVCDFLSKESNMPEYNDLVVAYRDLENITPQSKICWSQCPQILFIKPRDFVTFCHHRWRKDGTQIVINQACEHQDAVGNNEEGEGKLVRAHALRGANFISKDPDDPMKTRIAMLAHANPGGGMPQWAMKTAVNAVAPIEPFKLFYRINESVSMYAQNRSNNMVHKTGYKQKGAGLSQLGYACFWPSGDDNNNIPMMQ